jgi:hypothetical protein
LMSLLIHVPGLAASFLLTLTSLLTQFPGPATAFSFSILTSRLSDQAKIRRFQSDRKIARIRFELIDQPHALAEFMVIEQPE